MLSVVIENWEDDFFSLLFFFLKWNVLTTIEWIAIKFGTDSYGLHTITCNNFGDPLRHHQVKMFICPTFLDIY